MIFICPLDICAYKLNSFFFLFISITYIKKKHTNAHKLFLFLFFSLYTLLTSYKSQKFKINQNSTLNNSKILQNKPPETTGSVEGLLESAETAVARGSHAPPPLAARGPTRRHEKQPETGGSATTSSPPFPSLPAVRTASPAKLNKTQHPVDFNFSLLFRSDYPFLFFRCVFLCW